MTGRMWRGMKVYTGPHAPTDGPHLLVLSKNEEEAVRIIKQAFDQGLIFVQGVTDISESGRTLDDTTKDSPMGWLTALKSPNRALWAETDAYGNDCIQTMGRDNARSLQGFDQ